MRSVDIVKSRRCILRSLLFNKFQVYYKSVTRRVLGICSGTKPIKSNWTCSRSLQLGVVCVFRKSLDNGCLQPSHHTASNRKVTNITHLQFYNDHDRHRNCKSSRQQQITAVSFCSTLPPVFLNDLKCMSALSSHVPRKLT